jgi:hypothetical protein
MSKLMLSLHVVRPEIDLEHCTGFRVYDYKSLRLCDQAISEGCFGRHSKASFCLMGALVDDTYGTSVAPSRIGAIDGSLVTEPNEYVFVRGLGTSVLSWQFGSGFHPDVAIVADPRKWQASVKDVLLLERTCDALGGSLKPSDFNWLQGHWRLERATFAPVRTRKGVTLRSSK